MDQAAFEKLNQILPQISEVPGYGKIPATDAIAAHQKAAVTSIRWNPNKPVSNKPELEPVPWNPSGVYLEERPVFTLDPLFHAGAYYVQEASSMFVEHAFKSLVETIDTPIRVLDLCAAPGGKSTLLAALLKEDDLLISNEVIQTRAAVLAENYKNNSWKLLHVTPQGYPVIFLAKLTVILVMMLQFLVFFNIGIYIAGVLPGLLFGVPYPKQPIPYVYVIGEDVCYFIACLPIVALQYLISLRFKNFLVPVGSGIALWILSVAVLSWKYGYAIPYTYCSFNYLKGQPKFSQPDHITAFALGYFILFTIIAYLLYIYQKEKG